MKVCELLTCVLLLALWDENTGVTTGTVGGNVTHQCKFYFSGERKMFCKNRCENKDILVETTGDSARAGRYSINHTNSLIDYSVISVSITNLTKSDSGWYRCGLDRKVLPDSSAVFELRVEDAPVFPTTPKFRPFSTSTESTTTPATTQRSSSGSPTPSSNPPETSEESEQQQTSSAAGLANTGTLLYVALTLVIMLILLSAAVLIFCCKKAKKPKETPKVTDYADVTQANRVYEDIREEDRPDKTRPLEMRTVYAYAEETNNEYSLATAPSYQRKPEDDSSKLTYSEVTFSSSAAALLSAAPHVNADDTVYSVLK